MSITRDLLAYVEPWRRAHYEPGKRDCAQFVRGWVREQTGNDVGGDVEYTTLSEGIRALREAGIDDHVALAAQHLTEVHPAFAQEGDVAVIDISGGQALAILAGEFVYAVGVEGLHIAPRTAMTRAFTWVR